MYGRNIFTIPIFFVWQNRLQLILYTTVRHIDSVLPPFLTDNCLLSVIYVETVSGMIVGKYFFLFGHGDMGINLCNRYGTMTE